MAVTPKKLLYISTHAAAAFAACSSEDIAVTVTDRNLLKTWGLSVLPENSRWLVCAMHRVEALAATPLLAATSIQQGDLSQ